MIGVAQVIGMNPILRSFFSRGPPSAKASVAVVSGKNCPRAASAVDGCAEVFGEEPESLHGNGGEHPGLVAEVVGGGGVGDADPASHVPEAEVLGSRLGQSGGGGVDHLLAQVALVVDPDAPDGLHAISPHSGLTVSISGT